MDDQTTAPPVIAGGHPERFIISEAHVEKRTSSWEVESYESIFNPDLVSKQSPEAQQASIGLRRFVPKYYGWKELEPEFHTRSLSKIIVLENLLAGMPVGSIMDIKMGTSTITKNTESKTNPDEIERSKRKDEQTTSAALGFRITGYINKNGAGEVTAKAKKQYKDITKEHIPDIFRAFLACNDREGPNLELRDQIVSELTAFLKYQREVNFFRRITGASLLMVLDNTVNRCCVKLIDLASVYDVSDRKQDDGFIKGLESLIAFFADIQ